MMGSSSGQLIGESCKDIYAADSWFSTSKSSTSTGVHDATASSKEPQCGDAGRTITEDLESWHQFKPLSADQVFKTSVLKSHFLGAAGNDVTVTLRKCATEFTPGDSATFPVTSAPRLRSL